MKLTFGILFLAFVTLGCQLQFSDAEEFSSHSLSVEKQQILSSLARKKRFAFLIPLVSLIASWGAGVSGAAAATLAGGAALATGSTLGTAAAVGLGAGALTAAASTLSTAVTAAASTAATAATATLGGIAVNTVLQTATLGTITAALTQTRKMLAITGTRPVEDDVDFNLEILDKYVNRNFDEDNPLKVLIERDSPELLQYLHFSTRGYLCDQKFCDNQGNGVYAFGICSPYFCSCSLNGAEGQKCRGSLIYDPIYNSCDVPYKIKVCGI